MSTTEKQQAPNPVVTNPPGTSAATGPATAAAAVGITDGAAASGGSESNTGIAGSAARPDETTTESTIPALGRGILPGSADAGNTAHGVPPQTTEALLHEILRQVNTTKRLATEQVDPPPHLAAPGTATPPSPQKIPQSGPSMSPPSSPPPPGSPGSPGGGGDNDKGDGNPSVTLRETVDEIDVTTRGLADQLQNSRELIETIAGDVAGSRAELGVVRARSEDLTRTLGQVGQDITEVKGVAKGVLANLAEYRVELAPVLDAAKRERTELRSAIKQVQDSISSAQHNATETRREVQELQKALGDSDENALRYRDELKGELDETHKRLTQLHVDVDERLGPNIATLTTSLKEHADRTAPVLTDVKAGVTAVTSSLTNSVLPKIEETGKSVALLAESTRQLNRDLKTAQIQIQEKLSRDLTDGLSKVASAEGLGGFEKRATDKLNAVEKKQEQADASLRGLTEALPSDLKVRLDALAASLAKLANDAASGIALGAVADRVEQIQTSVGLELGLKLRDVGNDLKAIQGTLDDVATADALTRLHDGLKATEERLKAVVALTEAKLGAKIDTLLEVAQQAANGTAAGVLGVGELKEPVGAVKRSVGDALELRLGIVHRDLGELSAEVKRKLDELTREVTATHAALVGSVLPSLKEARTASQSIGVQMDKRSEEVRAAVTEAAKATSKVVKERVEAVSQAVNQLGSQRTQDHATLLQQVHQLRSDVTAPLDQIATSVGDGLAQRIDSQTTTLGELARATSERLGGVATTLATVKQSTDSLGSDLTETRSVLDRLATAVPLHHSALMGELASVRTLTQDGLVTTVRNSGNDLKNYVLSLDAKVETRVEALKTQLSQLADRGGQQHAQVVADVSAIRDLVRADGSTQSRLAEALQRKLDDTQQQMTVLTADTKHYQSALLNDIGGVHSAVTHGVQTLEKGQSEHSDSLKGLEISIKEMFDRLQKRIEDEIDKKLTEKTTEIANGSRNIHDFVASLKQSLDQNNLADKLRLGLADNINSLDKRLDPLTRFLATEEKKLEEIKTQSGNNGVGIEGNRKAITDLDIKIEALGGKFEGKFPGTWKAFSMISGILILLGIIAFFVVPVITSNKIKTDLEEKINKIAEAQDALKKCDERTDKLVSLADATRNKIGSGKSTIDEQLAELKALATKPPAGVAGVAGGRPARQPPLPSQPQIPQINNTISLSPSCCGLGAGGQGSTVNCTCLGKTTTTTPPPPNTSAKEHPDSKPEPTSPKK